MPRSDIQVLAVFTCPWETMRTLRETPAATGKLLLIYLCSLAIPCGFFGATVLENPGYVTNFKSAGVVFIWSCIAVAFFYIVIVGAIALTIRFALRATAPGGFSLVLGSLLPHLIGHGCVVMVLVASGGLAGTATHFGNIATATISPVWYFGGGDGPSSTTLAVSWSTSMLWSLMLFTLGFRGKRAVYDVLDEQGEDSAG